MSTIIVYLMILECPHIEVSPEDSIIPSYFEITIAPDTIRNVIEGSQKANAKPF